jgi:hypothetical protein
VDDISATSSTSGVPVGENEAVLVGLGVAMKNAREAVKAVAAETCDFTNDEDGVARRCEELIAQGLL